MGRYDDDRRRWYQNDRVWGDAAKRSRGVYVRCADCLACAMIPPEQQEAARAVPDCQCGGILEVMGEVTADGWRRLGEVCPCDDRCTCAKGPRCDCSCGGENHGRGMAADIVVEVAAGGKPRLILHNAAKARVIAQEYRELDRKLRDRLCSDPAYSAKNRGEYVSAPDFRRYLEVRRWLEEVNRAGKLRSHAGRMKVLNSVSREVSP